MSENRSASPTSCGFCGGNASPPERFNGLDPAEIASCDGLFNVCAGCGAECSGTGPYNVSDRWFWTAGRSARRGRAALEAAQIDAELHADRLDVY